MGASDPELRMRQLAQLRAAYDAWSGLPTDQTDSSTARHSRVLLGRILGALTDSHGSAGVKAGGAAGKARIDA